MKTFRNILAILILQAVLFAGLSFAASTSEQILFGTSSGGQTAVTTDTTGSTFCVFGQNDRDFIFWLNSKFNSGTSTLDAKIQYTLDGGANWKDLYSFAQQTTSDAKVAVHLPSTSTFVPRCLRVYLDVGASGSPNYSVLVKALFARGQ